MTAALLIATLVVVALYLTFRLIVLVIDVMGNPDDDDFGGGPR
jgi:hypothetical protein